MAISLRPTSFQLSSSTFDGLSGGLGGAFGLGAAWEWPTAIHREATTIRGRYLTRFRIGRPPLKSNSAMFDDSCFHGREASQFVCPKNHEFLGRMCYTCHTSNTR